MRLSQAGYVRKALRERIVEVQRGRSGRPRRAEVVDSIPFSKAPILMLGHDSCDWRAYVKFTNCRTLILSAIEAIMFGLEEKEE